MNIIFELKKSDTLLFSSGLCLAFFGVIQGLFGIEVSPYFLFGVTIFTLMIGFSDLADKEDQYNYVFWSVPVSLTATSLVMIAEISGANLQKFNDSFTMIALGILLVTFAFSDSEVKEDMNKQEESKEKEDTEKKPNGVDPNES